MRAWEKARINGQRVFYEAYTDTIRLYPENYCLAHRTGIPAKWNVYPWEGCIRDKREAIQTTLDSLQDDCANESMADEIGKLF